MRVIPVQSAIEGETRRASYEEVCKYINENDVFAAADCQCRIAARQHGEGCGHTAEEMCLVLGPVAEYEIRTGRARRITREEAFAIIEKAEEEGLVHQIPNLMGPGRTTTICNCCGCSCLSLINANLYRNPDRVRSNYVSHVDQDKCIACGQCVENCQVNALTLGQGLCAIKAVAPAEMETPYDTEWGPDKWNPDYKHRQIVAESGTSPCKTECPAHIAIQGYIKMASLGKYKEALELIKLENPFPAICGRVCSRKCESACTRADLDDPIAIDEIKKFIAEQDLQSEHRFIPEKKSPRPEKIAVVGSGPAGLSCAYFLAVEGYQVTVFEKEFVLGGMLTLGIPSFRLEKEIIHSEIEILKELGVEFITGVEIGKHITLHELRRTGYKAFYLAIGAQGSRKLNLAGEEAEGVISGVEFLRSVNLQEECKLEGTALIIGGGNVAIDVARTAARLGASQTEIYCLEERPEMPALDEEVEEAAAEGIVFNNGWGPVRILAKNGHVAGVEFKKCLSVFDEEGKFNPVFDETEIKTVKANHVLISVGQEIAWGELLKGSRMELRSNRTVKAEDLSFQTGDADVFAGGDVVTGPGFAIDAIAMGKQGAISIHRYVHGDNLTLSREREYHALDKEDLNLDGYDCLPRQRPVHIDAGKSKETFKDLRVVLTEEQIKKETDRCLGCGVVVVDDYQCVGCGICTTKCKFDAISLVRKYDHPSVKPKEIKPTIMKYMTERQQRIAAKEAGK
jgi:NADPH-dependent glutamate synthase beta subunit-like oxidoreductase